jgi:hypothetical protein
LSGGWIVTRRSKRPGRSSAGSRTSGLDEAAAVAERRASRRREVRPSGRPKPVAA